MAQDIVPIELSLPQGDVVTLWAPKWRENGEEWEAFLGHEEDLYAFSDVAHLAAYARSATNHDLADHPAWPAVPSLTLNELTPDDDHYFDLIGVPELVAEDPDQWVTADLADIVAIVRSLADVCELTEVHEILDSAAGFSLLHQGTFPFLGKDGEARWTELGTVIMESWDKVLDVIDGVVSQPGVDPKALAAAQTELADQEGSNASTATNSDESKLDAVEATSFWARIGIDPIKIITSANEYYTLRCYLDDKPVFLGANGKIDVFNSTKALTRYLATGDGDSAEDHPNDLAQVSTWPEVVNAATNGTLDIEVDVDNTYVLTGLADDLAAGTELVDPHQLDLAVEFITDAARWAHDDSVDQALASSESLGWLVSYILQPDPTRLAPSAPFTIEVESWQTLVSTTESRLQEH